LALEALKTIPKQIYEQHWQARNARNDGDNSNKLFPNEIFDSVAAILNRGKRLLDVGCGSGAFMELVNAKFDEVHGCDISETALREATKRGMKSLCLDLNQALLPYQNDSFDGITCLEVIEHVLDPLRLLRDLQRALRPKGQLILTTPNIRYFRNLTKLIFKGAFPHTTTDSFVWGGGHLHYFTRKDLDFLLGEAGFERVAFHMNQEQFEHSWKRRLLLRVTGQPIFREWFCGGIIAEAFKG